MDLLDEADGEDAVDMSGKLVLAGRRAIAYTSRLSQVHIRPHERPVILTKPKRRCHGQLGQARSCEQR